MDVFDLVAKLSLDDSEYNSGLSDAESKASSFGSGLKTAMGVGAVAVGAVTTAVGAVTGKFMGGISSLAEYTDHIDKQSQKMGLSAKAYQEWDAVLQHSGASIDSMARGMTTLSKQAESNSDAFAQLGITQEELASMNQEELFSRTIEGLQGMEAGTERTALAQQLLGGSSKELGALLNTSAEETQAMKDRVEELGGVMSDEAVKAGAQFQDSLQDMKTALGGLKNNMMDDFLPSVTTMMDGLTEIFSGNSDKGIGMMTDGINDFIDNLGSAMDSFGQVGGGIISALIDAISNNLDNLLSAGATIMGKLADSLIKNLPVIFASAGKILGQVAEGILSRLPDIANTAVQIIISLANGIANSLPTLVPTVVEVILQIGQTIIENLPELISAGMEIAMGLLQGLIEAIPMIVEAVPELIDAILTTLTESSDAIFDGALEMFLAIVDAIPDIIDALVDALPQIIDSVVNFLTGDGLPKILEGAVKMFMGIVEAIPEIIVKLGEKLPEILASIIASIGTWVSDLFDKAVEVFGAIFDGFVEGIADIWDWITSLPSKIMNKLMEVWSELVNIGAKIIEGIKEGIFKGGVEDAIRSKVRKMVDVAKEEADIHSPSRVFRDEVGKMMAKGLEVGWSDEMDKVNDEIRKDLDFGEASLDLSVNKSYNTMPIEAQTTMKLSDADIDKIVKGLSITLYNTTEIDSVPIKQEIYKYTVDRMDGETKALQMAQGGAF